MAGKPVVAGGQAVPGGAVLGAADGLLMVFDPDTDGKGLGFHGNAAVPQQGEGVPSRVARCQNQGICFQLVQLVRAGDGHGVKLTALNLETGDLMAETDVTA